MSIEFSDTDTAILTVEHIANGDIRFEILSLQPDDKWKAEAFVELSPKRAVEIAQIILAKVAECAPANIANQFL